MDPQKTFKGEHDANHQSSWEIIPTPLENCCGNGWQCIGFNYYTNFSKKKKVCSYDFWLGCSQLFSFFYIIIFTLHSCVSWLATHVISWNPFVFFDLCIEKSLGMPFYMHYLTSDTMNLICIKPFHKHYCIHKLQGFAFASNFGANVTTNTDLYIC